MRFVGFAVFILSDSVIILSRVSVPIPHANPIIFATYYAAQASVGSRRRTNSVPGVETRAAPGVQTPARGRAAATRRREQAGLPLRQPAAAPEPLQHRLRVAAGVELGLGHGRRSRRGGGSARLDDGSY